VRGSGGVKVSGFRCQERTESSLQVQDLTLTLRVKSKHAIKRSFLSQNNSKYLLPGDFEFQESTHDSRQQLLADT
jgi:hypothetical protein